MTKQTLRAPQHGAGEQAAVHQFQRLQRGGRFVALGEHLVADRPSQGAAQVRGRHAPIAAGARRAGAGLGRNFPLARDGADGVDKLFGGDAAKFGTAEHVFLIVGRSPPDDRHLVSARRHDGAQQVLQILTMGQKVAGQPVEQLRVPRFAVHVVHVLHDPAAQQAGPIAIHQRAGRAPVARIGEHARGRGPAVGQRFGCGRHVQFGVEETGGGELARRIVAAHQFQLRAFGEIGGQPVGVLQLPMADEAVVAGVAFEVDAQEHLRAVLRRLHHGSLAGVDVAAPVHPQQESVGRTGLARAQQGGHELVVGEVAFERGGEPIRDALAATVVAVAAIVAQQVVPEADPVAGVVAVVGQQVVDQLFALATVAALDELFQRFGRGQQSPDIQVSAACEGGIADDSNHGIRVDDAIDGMGGHGHPRGNRRGGELELRRPRRAGGRGFVGQAGTVGDPRFDYV